MREIASQSSHIAPDSKRKRYVGTITYCAPVLQSEIYYLHFHDQMCEGLVEKDSFNNINQPVLAATNMCLIPFLTRTWKTLFQKTYDKYLALTDGMANMEAQSIAEGYWINFRKNDLIFDDRHYTPLPGKKPPLDTREHFTS